ncbi:MAG: hypothetical protein ABJF88_06395 [Rhodothermales bacterium]
MDSPASRLDIDADLSLSVDGEPISVHSEGDELVATFRSVRKAISVLRTLPFPTGPGRRATIRTASGVIAVTGLDVLVRVGRRTVARAGPAARPGVLSRLLRLGNVQVFAREVVLASVGR